jgi:DNA-binding MarR family transcriptional regulator
MRNQIRTQGSNAAVRAPYSRISPAMTDRFVRAIAADGTRWLVKVHNALNGTNHGLDRPQDHSARMHQLRKKAVSVRGIQAVDESAYIGGIDNIVGFHVRLAHGTIYRHFTGTFTELGLTQKQVSVLWLVSDHPGTAQTNLSKRLQLDRATVMAIVNRLVARKFLVRGESATDRRKQTLKLLPAGTEILKDAKKAIRIHEGWLKSRFTAKELETLISLLRRIHG